MADKKKSVNLSNIPKYLLTRLFSMPNISNRFYHGEKKGDSTESYS